MRMFVACRLPHVALRAARRLPFAADLPVLSIVVCRLPLGAWCLPFCLAAAVCPGLSALSLAARRFPLVLAPFRPRRAFRRLLRALAIFPYRRMSNLRAPRAALTPLKHTLHFAVTCVSRS